MTWLETMKLQAVINQQQDLINYGEEVCTKQYEEIQALELNYKVSIQQKRELEAVVEEQKEMIREKNQTIKSLRQEPDMLRKELDENRTLVDRVYDSGINFLSIIPQEVLDNWGPDDACFRGKLRRILKNSVIKERDLDWKDEDSMVFTEYYKYVDELSGGRFISTYKKFRAYKESIGEPAPFDYWRRINLLASNSYWKHVAYVALEKYAHKFDIERGMSNNGKHEY